MQFCYLLPCRTRIRKQKLFLYIMHYKHHNSYFFWNNFNLGEMGRIFFWRQFLNTALFDSKLSKEFLRKCIHIFHSKDFFSLEEVSLNVLLMWTLNTHNFGQDHFQLLRYDFQMCLSDIVIFLHMGIIFQCSSNTVTKVFLFILIFII